MYIPKLDFQLWPFRLWWQKCWNADVSETEGEVVSVNECGRGLEDEERVTPQGCVEDESVVAR